MAQTLRVLARQRHAQPHVRIRQRDHQAMHVRHLASDPGPGHAEIDLHAARRPLEPHVPLAIRHAAVRLAPPVHVTHRGRILAVVVRLRQQTVVHAPDRVPLLPGQQTIGLQPLVHQMRVRVDLRPVPAIRLRLGRAILHIRVLRDRPAIHVKTPRYLRARHSLPVESPDILHNGHRYRHVPFLPERRPAATGRIKTDWQLGNIQAAAPMPLTSPGNDDDTGENHQPTLRKNTAEPVEQTLKQNTRCQRNFVFRGIKPFCVTTWWVVCYVVGILLRGGGLTIWWDHTRRPPFRMNRSGGLLVRAGYSPQALMRQRELQGLTEPERGRSYR